MKIVPVLLILAPILFAGCINQDIESKYKIVSLIDFNEDLCSDITKETQVLGFNSAEPHIILKDNITGKQLDGISKGVGQIQNPNKGLGEQSWSEYQWSEYQKRFLKCSINSNLDYYIISVYSSGYTPVSFKFPVQKNKMATIEVPLAKSCTGGPSYFENLEVDFLRLNDSKTIEKDREYEHNMIFRTVKDNTGLEKSEFEITCLEHFGYFSSTTKIKGKTTDGFDFELVTGGYGGNSSGSGSNSYRCFATASEKLFEFTKNNWCNQLTSVEGRHDDNGSYTILKNNTQEIIAECLNGKFDKIEGNKKAISLSIFSSRTSEIEYSGARNSEFYCLNN